MSKKIIGLDIGTYAVKVIHLDPKGDLPVLYFDEERIVASPAPAAAPERAAGEEDDEVASAFGADETVEAQAAAEDGDESEQELPEGEEAVAGPPWRAAVEALAARGALDGDYLVCGLPGTEGMTIHVEVPFDDRSKVASVLPHLLVDRLPMDQREVVSDFRVHAGDGVDEDGEPLHEALVGFARADDVGAFLAASQPAGVDPVILGIPELFLATAASGAGVGAGEAVALLDIGHTYTRLVVVQDGRLLLGRTIRVGGQGINEAIAAAFDIEAGRAESVKHDHAMLVAPESAPNEQMRQMSEAIARALRPLIRDVRRSLQALFARRRCDIGALYITGGTSRIANLDAWLGQQLGVPVRRLSTPRLAELPARHQAVAPMALGQALTYADERARGRAINLRRGPFTYRGRSSYLRKQVVLLGAMAAAVLLVLVAAFFLQMKSYESQRDAMRGAVRAQTEKLFGEPLTERSAIQARLVGEEGGAMGFVPKMSAYQLTYELVSRISTDTSLSLDRLEVDVDRNLVQIMGETTDAQAVDRLVGDLEQLECLKEIRKDKLRVAGEKADFELQISSGCS